MWNRRNAVAQSKPSGTTRRITEQVKNQLNDTVNRARQDIGRVDDPKAEALLETTAEVLLGLMKAYDDYASGQESAWQ